MCENSRQGHMLLHMCILMHLHILTTFSYWHTCIYSHIGNPKHGYRSANALIYMREVLSTVTCQHLCVCSHMVKFQLGYRVTVWHRCICSHMRKFWAWLQIGVYMRFDMCATSRYNMLLHIFELILVQVPSLVTCQHICTNWHVCKFWLWSCIGTSHLFTHMKISRPLLSVQMQVTCWCICMCSRMQVLKVVTCWCICTCSHMCSLWVQSSHVSVT